MVVFSPPDEKDEMVKFCTTQAKKVRYDKKLRIKRLKSIHLGEVLKKIYTVL